jgi:signal transduction histidine kinase
VDAIPALVETLNRDGLDVAYSVVAEPDRAVDRLRPALGLTLYRTVQEALHNVRRHSTAHSATVVLRVDETAPKGGFAEVEILDSGRPRTGTSGTGLGLLGMRERVASLDGSLEIGPRATGGFRVRVRLPLGSDRTLGLPGLGQHDKQDSNGRGGMRPEDLRSQSRRAVQSVESGR